MHIKHEEILERDPLFPSSLPSARTPYVESMTMISKQRTQLVGNKPHIYFCMVDVRNVSHRVLGQRSPLGAGHISDPTFSAFAKK